MMTLFSYVCPGLASEEPLVLRVEPSDNSSLPPGEYIFRERYCEDLACDCRRVFFDVVSTSDPQRLLACINYGWESREFYASQLGGNPRSAREITSASLDPLHPQSEWARALLKRFRKHLEENPDCAPSLQRHYEAFKRQVSRDANAAGEWVEIPSSVAEILQRLTRVPQQTDFAPFEAALQAAIHQREAIVPELIAALDRVTANPVESLEKFESSLHEFALCLLAHFREPRALEPFLRFFSLPGDLALDLTGDLVTENGARVLASVCGGDPAPLLRLALDEQVNDYVRQQAMLGLLVQHVWGERTRDDLVGDLRGLFARLPRSEEDFALSALIGAVCDFDVRELLPEVRQVFADGAVDELMVGSLEKVEGELGARPLTSPYQRSAEERVQQFIEDNPPFDAISEISSWVCFRGPDDEDYFDDEFEKEDFNFLPSPLLPGPAPFQAPPKVGRNDLCPCGSGKKFKKCCG